MLQGLPYENRGNEIEILNPASAILMKGWEARNKIGTTCVQDSPLSAENLIPRLIFRLPAAVVL